MEQDLTEFMRGVPNAKNMPPLPKPLLKETGWLLAVETVVANWLSCPPNELTSKILILEAMLADTVPTDLYSRHFYARAGEWVEWPTTKHAVLNANIYCLKGKRARSLLEEARVQK